MNQAFKNLNEIPVLTWSWLHVNDTDLKQDFPAVLPYQKNPVQEVLPVGVELSSYEKTGDLLLEQLPVIKAKKELLDYMSEKHNSGYKIRIPEGREMDKPILLSYVLDGKSPVLTDNILILAEKGSKATVIIQYTSEGADSVSHSGMTRIRAEAGAEITLVKVQMLSEGSSHVDHVAASIEENAKVQVLLAELGAQESITNCSLDLIGEAAEGRIDSIYLGDGERRLDINYIVTHSHKNTVSNIYSSGVMADRCEKVFRGTIDFKSGASGSKGSEEEVTVLLSPEIVNISTPLLLCGEEDVEGAHAVSTGTIDEDMLFYLMTRGFDEAEAKKVIVEASFSPVLEKIEDERLRENIFSYVRERLSRV